MSTITVSTNVFGYVTLPLSPIPSAKNFVTADIVSSSDVISRINKKTSAPFPLPPLPHPDSQPGKHHAVHKQHRFLISEVNRQQPDGQHRESDRKNPLPPDRPAKENLRSETVLYTPLSDKLPAISQTVPSSSCLSSLLFCLFSCCFQPIYPPFPSRARSTGSTDQIPGSAAQTPPFFCGKLSSSFSELTTLRCHSFQYRKNLQYTSCLCGKNSLGSNSRSSSRRDRSLRIR